MQRDGSVSPPPQVADRIQREFADRRVETSQTSRKSLTMSSLDSSRVAQNSAEGPASPENRAANASLDRPNTSPK